MHLFPLFFPCLLALPSIPSASGTAASRAIELASAKGLATHAEWLALGQYHRRLFGGYRSEVVSPAFFLDSGQGPDSPGLELRATLEALLEPVSDTAPDSHAACRFPARKAWLIRQGVLPDSLPSPDCQALDRWMSHGRASSMSLVFATGYLKNPASYFGHIFLKFNAHPMRSTRNLNNQTVNFGADLRANDNPIVYAAKGLTGGYPGIYTRNDFYTQRFQYGDNQLRDLWEFELEIPQEEVAAIAMRLWELFGKSFRYYFLDRNCAYYIVKPLEDQLGVEFFPDLLPYALPKHAIEAAAGLRTPGGAPWIRDFQYIPSRQAVFYARYADLNAEERKGFRALIRPPRPDFQDSAYVRLPEGRKANVIETMIDYHDFVHAGTDGVPEFDEKRRRLILERLKWSAGVWSGDSVSGPRARPPTEGPRTNMLALSAEARARAGEPDPRISLRWRPANHDFLTGGSARAPHSELEVFDMEVYFSHRSFGVKRFNLLQMQALNSTKTGLPGDGHFAWALRFGYGEDRIGCDGCGVFLANALYGYAFGNSAELPFPYLLAGGQVQSSRENSGHALLIAKGGLLTDAARRVGMRAEAGLKIPLDGDRASAPFAEAEMRIALSRFADLRFRAGHEYAPVLGMAVFGYF